MEVEYLKKLLHEEFVPLNKIKESISYLTGELKIDDVVKPRKVNIFPRNFTENSQTNEKFVDLQFSHCGDQSGVFYYIGKFFSRQK